MQLAPRRCHGAVDKIDMGSQQQPSRSVGKQSFARGSATIGKRQFSFGL